VGSNGKSSTARMISAILESHGFRSATYTSPHLGSFVERIEIQGAPVSEEEFAEALTETAAACELVNKTLADDQITQFEALTACAYLIFARRGVDVAVVEAGLGGRYDATNVIPSKVQVLTGVSLEHTRWLGSTLEQIATEKLAVVPDHGLLVCGDLPPSVDNLCQQTATRRHADLVRAPGETPHTVAVRGSFQRRNFALASTAAKAFMGYVDIDAVQRAASSVNIPGRCQVVESGSQLIIYDGAHNPEGIGALVQAIPELVDARRLTAVVSILEDKDASTMLEVLLPVCDEVIFTRCSNPRSLEPHTLCALASDRSECPTTTASEPKEAMALARSSAGKGGAVLATGSIHLVADLLGKKTALEASSF
jgi:dihydrofolate synthase / folylpolyglutamate synthase